MNNLKLLLAYRKNLLLTILVVAIFSALISLVLPKTFRAKAVIVPPVIQDSLSPLSMISDLGGVGGLLNAGQDQISLLRIILDSRSMLTHVSEKFNLQARYDTDDIEETIEQLDNNTEIEITPEGAITISIDVKTDFLPDSSQENEARRLSASLVNEFVARLDQTNRSLASQQSRSNRLFIESRYNEILLNLATAEEALMEFQEKYGMVSLPEQVEAAISIASRFESELGVAEIQLKIKESSLGKNHPEVLQSVVEVEQLKNKMASLMGVQSQLDSSLMANRSLFPVFSDVPELGKKYLRAIRDLEVQGLVYEFITQEFERSKIEEARDTPTIQIIDRAIPPIKKYRPMRSLIVIFSTFFSVLIFIALIVVRDRFSSYQA